MPSTVMRSNPKSAATESEQRSCEVPCADVLRKTSLFTGLSDEQLRLVTPPCRGTPLCQGRVLFASGDEARAVYVVLSGEVCLEQEVSIDDRLPARTIVVETVGQSGVFGLCALVKPYRSLFTARCTKEAQVIAVDSQDLKALIKAHPAVGLVVLENAFRISYERLMRSHQRIMAEVGLAAMYDAHRNY